MQNHHDRKIRSKIKQQTCCSRARVHTKARAQAANSAGCTSCPAWQKCSARWNADGMPMQRPTPSKFSCVYYEGTNSRGVVIPSSNTSTQNNCVYNRATRLPNVATRSIRFYLSFPSIRICILG